jgi:chromosome segregation ATPase
VRLRKSSTYLAYGAVFVGGVAFGLYPETPQQRIEERLNEFDRAARQVEKLDKRVTALEGHVAYLEDRIDKLEREDNEHDTALRALTRRDK